jgi:sRNA-binding carbon storage regulator CsrA
LAIAAPPEVEIHRQEVPLRYKPDAREATGKP